MSLLSGGVLLAGAARATEPVPPSVPARAPARAPAIDGDLLEFLGSVDSDEAGWHDYLAQTDVEQVVKHRKPNAADTTTPPARGAGDE